MFGASLASFKPARLTVNAAWHSPNDMAGSSKDKALLFKSTSCWENKRCEIMDYWSYCLDADYSEAAPWTQPAVAAMERLESDERFCTSFWLGKRMPWLWFLTCICVQSLETTVCRINNVLKLLHTVPSRDYPKFAGMLTHTQVYSDHDISFLYAFEFYFSVFMQAKPIGWNFQRHHWLSGAGGWKPLDHQHGLYHVDFRFWKFIQLHK